MSPKPFLSKINAQLLPSKKIANYFAQDLPIENSHPKGETSPNLVTLPGGQMNSS
jgi:hypothetical protein